VALGQGQGPVLTLGLALIPVDYRIKPADLLILITHQPVSWKIF